jgi:hypothetical protein
MLAKKTLVSRTCIKVTYDEAMGACAKQGMRMAAMRTRADMHALTKLCGGDGQDQPITCWVHSQRLSGDHDVCLMTRVGGGSSRRQSCTSPSLDLTEGDMSCTKMLRLELASIA